MEISNELLQEGDGFPDIRFGVFPNLTLDC